MTNLRKGWIFHGWFVGLTFVALCGLTVLASEDSDSFLQFEAGFMLLMLGVPWLVFSAVAAFAMLGSAKAGIRSAPVAVLVSYGVGLAAAIGAGALLIKK